MMMTRAAVVFVCAAVSGCMSSPHQRCAGAGPCEVGEACGVNTDCDSGSCAAGSCAALPCDDGVRDGAETDVDCGGASCRKCSGARHCEVDADCFSGTCRPGVKTCSSIAVSFADEVRYVSGFKAFAIFSEDLDGDGDPDIAIANEYGSSISVFVNDHDRAGTFRHLENPAGAPDDTVFNKNFPTGAYPTGGYATGAYPTGGALGDFDGDGRPDVITANYHGNSVSILFNTGTGALDAPVSYPTLACRDPSNFASCPQTSNLAIGDLNHDGALDVIASNPGRGSVSEFLGHPGTSGHGDGTLDAAIDLPVGGSGGSQPYSVAIADFNGDGHNDVAIGDDLTGNIIVRLGNGNGTFQPEVGYGIGGTRDYIVIARDIDLDGHLDLVCASRGSDSVSVLLGRGDGTFHKAIVASVRPMTAPASKLFAPFSIAVADFNNDGVPDVITPNFLADDATILIGIGNGRFEPAIEVPFHALTVPYGVVTGDFDHDGKIDFATANAGSDDLLVEINTGR